MATKNDFESCLELFARVVSRLQNLPAIALPTDYPRLSGSNKLIEAALNTELSEQTSNSLLKLALFDENEGVNDDESDDSNDDRPSPFHLFLAAFVVLLHRFMITVDTESSVYFDPTDPFWAIVKRVHQVEREAEADSVPFTVLHGALKLEGPVFRVRFFDETDSDQLLDDFIRSTNLSVNVISGRLMTKVQATPASMLLLPFIVSSALM
ncbi:large subunit of alpha-aminoadipate reductase [Marasmius sp. AFHP31]|nr:large subunit of alpha-aminoadipate reductase [Marasmius sp. AFHP31]